MVKFRVISIFLVFALICNMIPLRVFAKPEGNPILHNDTKKKIRDEVIKYLNEKCEENPATPISYKVNSKYTNDHRELRVHNMSYLISNKSMISSLANVLILCEKYKQQAIDNAKTNGTARNDEYIKLIRPILETSQDVKGFADSMGLPLKSTINAFIYETSFSEYRDAHFLYMQEEGYNGVYFFTYSLLSMVFSILGTAIGAKQFQAVSGKVLIGLGIGFAAVCGVLYGLGCNVIENKLEKEREYNIYNVIRFLENKMLVKNDSLRKQNLYITAIDKRNYSPLLFWNLGRENYGSWAGFTDLVGLKNAVQVQEVDKYDDMFTKYSEIFKLIEDLHFSYERNYE